MKDSFYGELEHVFHKFTKYHMNMLRNFNAKVVRKIFLNKEFGMTV
jgi:hypothetical protein